MTLEEQAAALSSAEIVALLGAHQSLSQNHEVLRQEHAKLETKLAEAEQSLEWFRRQYFGQKSERRAFEEDRRQLSLGEMLEPEAKPPAPTETIRSYQRRVAKKALEGQVEEQGLRFDSSVPVETIVVPNPEAEGKEEGKDYEVVSEKVTHRLAQRPAAYVVLKYVRQVIKLKSEDTLSCPPAPAAVLEKSVADVSFLAGLLVDKFVYHLPLYRQHLRLQAAGISLSRQTLTNVAQRAIELLEPVYYSQLSSILLSDVLMMDETPIKAGRKERGKLHQGYFWPILGDKGEIAFPFSPSRSGKFIGETLGTHCKKLVTDGYEAYARYAEGQANFVHAQCWAHTRRNFVEAESAEPELVKEVLRRIQILYENEEHIRKKGFEGEKKLSYRAEHSRPVVQELVTFLESEMRSRVLLPTNPFLKATSYLLQRQAGLEAFLADPEIPIDTNELERALRPIPMGRKNWLFCWTELGAAQLGKIQSLLQTCRMQGVNPYTYLVDVLQRIDTHPAFEVHLLTPRLWKEHFAAAPLTSDLKHISRA